MMGALSRMVTSAFQLHIARSGFAAAAMVAICQGDHAFADPVVLAQAMPGGWSQGVVVTVPSGGAPSAQPPAPASPAPQAAKPAKPKPPKATTAVKAPKPASVKAATGAAPPASATSSRPTQSIAILVNDEPITGYEIEQRAAFLSLQGGGGGADFRAKAEARWKQIVKDPKTNDRFKAMLQKNNVQSQEQARALQTTFVKQLQQEMIEQLKREQRQGAVAGSKEKARDELIEERLKMQAARQLNALSDDAEVERILTGMAERNKMTLDQFTKHMAGMGADLNTMRSRFKAEMSWREVIRKRFGYQVAITGRDVDRYVASAPAADDEVELQVQRITLVLPPKVDQSVIAQRIAEADGIAQRFTGCANASALAASVSGAKFEDLGAKKPGSIPEPTRSLLLNATEGDMLPPSVGAKGVELWALCGRKVLTGESQKRENAESELRQREFEVLAAKHLKDLRNDATIEYR